MEILTNRFDDNVKFLLKGIPNYEEYTIVVHWILVKGSLDEIVNNFYKELKESTTNGTVVVAIKKPCKIADSVYVLPVANLSIPYSPYKFIFEKDFCPTPTKATINYLKSKASHINFYNDDHPNFYQFENISSYL